RGDLRGHRVSIPCKDATRPAAWWSCRSRSAADRSHPRLRAQVLHVATGELDLAAGRRADQQAAVGAEADRDAGHLLAAEQLGPDLLPPRGEPRGAGGKGG